MRRVIIFIAGFLMFVTLSAQGVYRTGLMPSVNFTRKLTDDWRLNFKAESRVSIAESERIDFLDADMSYVLTDLSIIAARKAGIGKSVAGGYLIRIRDDMVSHRFIQQFTILGKAGNVRLSHRIAADETISKNLPPVYRLRYRIVADVPLNGQSVDPGEFYLKAGNEYLGSLQSGNVNIEIRVIPLIGYAFTDNNKFEGGIDYRISSLIDDTPVNSIWLALNWFISF